MVFSARCRELNCTSHTHGQTVPIQHCSASAVGDMDGGELLSAMENMDPTLSELGDEFTLGDIDGN